jgi:hypothetical protein
MLYTENGERITKENISMLLTEEEIINAGEIISPLIYTTYNVLLKEYSEMQSQLNEAISFNKSEYYLIEKKKLKLLKRQVKALERIANTKNLDLYNAGSWNEN